MKYFYTFLFLVCILNHAEAQDTTPPEAINDLEVTFDADGIEMVSALFLNWTLPFDDSDIVKYNVYNYDTFLYEINCNNCNSDIYPSVIENSTYCIKISAVDEYGNESSLSNEVCLDTNIYQYNSELFISQYYQYANNNALEIAVLPSIYNESIDLSIFDLRINLDGGTTWSTPLSLSGNIINDGSDLDNENNTYVICSNTSTSSQLIDNADLITSSEVLQFDGNDPIGLFKNGVLVDIFGNFNNDNTFAQNVNKVRDACFSFIPTTINSNGEYAPNFWIDYNSSCEHLTQTQTGLGRYTLCCLLSTKDIKLKAIKMSPNPITHSELKITHSTPIHLNNIELYDINGKHIESFQINYVNNEFLLNLPQLNKGVYFIKIYTDSKTVTKKLIKN